MKFILKIKMPMDIGNQRIKSPDFAQKMQQMLTEIKAEAAYFTTIEGCRGAYVIVNFDDASQMIATAEPFFLWLGAEVCYNPVMTPEDLGRGSGYMAAAVQHWG